MGAVRLPETTEDLEHTDGSALDAFLDDLAEDLAAALAGLGTMATAVASKAPLASPALTGSPTAPTAPEGTDTTQIATTAFVLANSGSGMEIGGEIAGATAGRFLRVGPGPVLADEDDLTTDGTTLTLGVGYPTIRNLVVAYGGIRLQHGPAGSTADGFTLQNIYNGGITSLLAGPGDFLSVTGAGGIAIHGIRSQQTGFTVDMTGGLWAFTAGLKSLWSGNTVDDVNQDAFQARPGAAQAAFWRPFAAYLDPADLAPSWHVDRNGNMVFGRRSSTLVVRKAASIEADWVSPTDANRKGRLAFKAADSTGSDREGLRVESDGTQALISFFGGTAAPRAAAIVDADGTIGDLTAKFNALLARLRAYTLLAP